MDNILVILAGGVGIRYGADVPKQYALIKGKKIIDYSLEEMTKSTETDKIIVVLNKDEVQKKEIEMKYDVEVIYGGKERAYSFQNALDHISSYYPNCQKVIFHEAARILVEHNVIDAYFKLLDEYDYVESCTKISDSLGSYVVHAPRREDYYLIQAPEAYRFSVLKQFFNCESEIYFAANQFPKSLRGYQFFGIENNIKLTTQADKTLIEYLIDSKNK